ncbi:MAG: GH32 C-terminal domain-containing protein [Muribaculaceae bacterium]|nr:GH32 C-terminal domain-containing protein [Muribaculaceae bacterium]
MKYLTPLMVLGAATILPVQAGRILHVPMQAQNPTMISEAVNGGYLNVYGRFGIENIPGAAGDALRFDGFSTYATGKVKAGDAQAQALTVSIWVAPETYPIIEHDVATSAKALLAGTYDDSAKAGWQFGIGQTGKYNFEIYSQGWKVSVEATDVLPAYQWSKLTAVCDGATKKVTLYRNGQKVGESKSMSSYNNTADRLWIGKSAQNTFSGPFLINTFNGLLDDIEVFDTALSESEVKNFKAENEADLSIPESRYANQALRPWFHGMPATAWTNECHGMTYSNGKYHLFFQKNANGPYMSRLHWGHISSPDLCNWTEEQIAITPGDSYDVKGCWSGAVFTDDVITGGKPNILYTGVDYAKATIDRAVPADDNLIKWNKITNNPVIAGRPASVTDDFRDPYFFRNGDKAYIIVGSSQNQLGVTTLHEYNATTGRFSNDGRLFFRSTSAAESGKFWEMPNVTKIGDKWLFTVTPLETSQGVRTLYWTGSINADGTFNTTMKPKTVELNSRDGYGLLSPTVYQHEGKTIALGIVPDKLGGSDNYTLGWAHCYSLPREWSLDADGTLIQKPYSGLANLRDNKGYSKENFKLSGSESLNPVEGRHVELLATFTAGNGDFGFNIFKGSNAGKIYYSASSGDIVADFSALSRMDNDGSSYRGIYRMTLPQKPIVGQQVKLQVFVDGSVIDIFVNDKWAQSIRVFPTDDAANGIEAYTTAPVDVKSLKAWNLVRGNSGVEDIFDSEVCEDANQKVDVYHISGRLIKQGVDKSSATEGLDSGLYLVGGKKILI